MRKLNVYGPSLIVLGTAILVLVVGPSAVWKLTYAQTKARIIQAGERLDENPVLQHLNQAYRDLATLVEPSVVHISTERTVPDGRGRDRIVGSAGSGWIYDEVGHIVTNYHVVEGAERIEVQLHSGEIRQAQIAGFDQFTDIAVIKIAPGHLHPALRADPQAVGHHARQEMPGTVVHVRDPARHGAPAPGCVHALGRLLEPARRALGAAHQDLREAGVDHLDLLVRVAAVQQVRLVQEVAALGVQAHGLDALARHQHLLDPGPRLLRGVTLDDPIELDPGRYLRAVPACEVGARGVTQLALLQGHRQRHHHRRSRRRTERR